VLAALAALMALSPGRAYAQPQGVMEYAPPSVPLPYPLYHTHPEAGGFFVDGGFLLIHQTNIMQDQQVAYRGFIVSSPTVPDPNNAARNLTITDQFGNQAFQGEFIGSRALALSTNQITGPYSFQPGFDVAVGWKFDDASTLTVDFAWLSEAQYRAVATLVNTPSQSFGNLQQDTFLTSFVFNFPSDFAGAPSKIAVPNPDTVPPFVSAPGAVFGIWNGSSVQTIVLWQRFQQLQVTYRKPFYETDCYRASYLIGPRYTWIEDKFRWMTTDLDTTGQSFDNWVGVYNNIIDNRMYGFHVGLQQEWYMGRGFAAMLTTQGAAFLDVVRERVDYELQSRNGPENKRSRTMWRAVPEFEVTPSIAWYPLEGIQLNFGWSLFAFFNTIASPRPIDFNYSALAPDLTDVSRWFTGFTGSIAFIF
jgi:hypothetical protein